MIHMSPSARPYVALQKPCCQWYCIFIFSGYQYMLRCLSVEELFLIRIVYAQRI